MLNCEEKGYKPVSVQDECFGGKYGKDITVLVRFEKKGKVLMTKYDARSFPDVNYLDKYIKKNKLKVVAEKDFKAPRVEQLLHLIKAI